VFLTPKGRALKRKLVPLAEEVNGIALRRLGKADVAAPARDAAHPHREPRARRREARRSESAMRLAELPPLSLYVHIPWCLKKCPYCDFNSHEKRGDLPEASTSTRSWPDLEASLPKVWGRRLHTIFIGGGTPSLFAPASIERLVTAVRTRLPVDPDTEITLEANPGTFEVERFRGFRAAGINRLSIGVQSFDDAKLAALGRVHGADEARRAIATALELFPTVNVDLMYALPGQTLDQALADVSEAIAHGVPHVSAYHLTLEPDTHFFRFPPQLPAEDVSADMQEAIEAQLAARATVTTRPRRSPNRATARAIT
jgi:oxygen-independent coproporphyrinogen-3 oxidase